VLSGLSPKQNRSVPPINYGLDVSLMLRFPHLAICIHE